MGGDHGDSGVSQLHPRGHSHEGVGLLDGRAHKHQQSVKCRLLDAAAAAVALARMLPLVGKMKMEIFPLCVRLVLHFVWAEQVSIFPVLVTCS
jgi:hypothetical protein